MYEMDRKKYEDKNVRIVIKEKKKRGVYGPLVLFSQTCASGYFQIHWGLNRSIKMQLGPYGREKLSL